MLSDSVRVLRVRPGTPAKPRNNETDRLPSLGKFLSDTSSCTAEETLDFYGRLVRFDLPRDRRDRVCKQLIEIGTPFAGCQTPQLKEYSKGMTTAGSVCPSPDQSSPRFESAR